MLTTALTRAGRRPTKASAKGRQRVHHDGRGPDIVQQRRERLRGCSHATSHEHGLGKRHALRSESRECLDRKLGFRIRRPVRRPEAKERPGKLGCHHRHAGGQPGGAPLGPGFVDRCRVEAGAPTPGCVDDVDGVPLAHEVCRPAPLSVGRGLVAHAGQPAAVHQHDGDGTGSACGVVHVHLVDGHRPWPHRAGRRNARMPGSDGLPVEQDPTTSAQAAAAIFPEV
jgi:hypothetical protein